MLNIDSPHEINLKKPSHGVKKATITADFADFGDKKPQKGTKTTKN